MLRSSSAAMGSRVLKQLISSSRPSSIHYLRPIIIIATPSPINPIVRYHHQQQQQLFLSDPNSQFTGVQFRNYTSGRPSKVVVDNDDSDEFDEDSDEFVDDSDDEVFDHDEFVDDLDESDDDDDDDEDDDEI